MKKLLSVLFAAAAIAPIAAAVEYQAVADWLKLPAGRAQMGTMHGDIAVSSSGEVYVSVESPQEQAGLQVYAADGTFVRNVPNAPPDLHGFVIRRLADGEFIYGARLRGQEVLKLGLDGKVALTIPASSIPDEFKVRNARSGQLAVLLTGVDVAANGDIYVTDGYASDFIHRFDRTGKYLKSFGGKQEPYKFNTLHKLAIDSRFQPARLIAVDRANNRVVHMSLEGAFLGVVAEGLLLPAAVVIDGDNAMIGELTGRITILDKAGAVVARVGTNTEQGVGTNRVPPDQWKTGLVVAPHGVALNARGDLFVSEFTTFGRVHRFNKR
jgi:hypothetical protein